MPALSKLASLMTILMSVLSTSPLATAAPAPVNGLTQLFVDKIKTTEPTFVQDSTPSLKNTKEEETISVANPSSILHSSAAADFSSASRISNDGIGSSSKKNPWYDSERHVDASRPLPLSSKASTHSSTMAPTRQPTTRSFVNQDTNAGAGPAESLMPIPDTSNLIRKTVTSEPSSFGERRPVLKYLMRVLFNKKEKEENEETPVVDNAGGRKSFGSNPFSGNSEKRNSYNSGRNEDDLNSDLDRALSNVFDI
jgi:hypothetical protein